MKVDEQILNEIMPDYPDINTSSLKDFNAQIASKKEFYDLILDKEEKKPELPGMPLKHQLYTSRFISPYTPYDSQLVFGTPGTGKTCLASLIIENHKTVYESEKIPFKKALVIVKNNVIERNFINEISQVCTSGEYIPQLTEKEVDDEKIMTDERYIRRLKLLIEQTYQLERIETFVSKLPSSTPSMNDDQWKKIYDEYSGRLIIIDEAHVLRLQLKKTDSVDIYKKMFRFLHFLDNVKIVLLTGTPIWDKANEIASLMNLILPISKQLPIGNDFDKKYFNNSVRLIKKDLLKDYFKGRVSYIRSQTAVKQYIGTTLPEFKNVSAYKCEMSEFQREQARKIINSKKEGALMTNSREVDNFVWKNGEYGNTWFKKNIIVKNRKYNFKSPEVAQDIRINLKKYSTKFYECIQYIIDNPKEIVFIYSDSVSGGGAILLGLCLELFGFSRASSATTKASGKKQRYSIFTSDQYTTNTDTAIQKTIKTLNDPENKYGDYIRIIIGSERVSTGLSFKNVRAFKLLSPYWNFSEPDQAMYRTLRFSGHNDLPQDERYVKIFNYCAVSTKNIKTKDYFETSDIRIYKIAEKKDYKTQQIYRAIRESAWDCTLAKNRNQDSNDVDNSRDCNYDSCKLSCDVNENLLKINDVGSYVSYYNDSKVNEFISSITELFRNYTVLHISQIFELLSVSKDEEITIIEALNTIINNNIIVKNKLGLSYYLKDDGNMFFLDSVLNKTDLINSFYTQNVYLNKKNTLKDLIDFADVSYIHKRIQDDKFRNEYCTNLTREKLISLPHTIQILYLEAAYKNVQKQNIVIDTLGKHIYTLKDKTVIHIMYLTEFTGSSYNVANVRLEASGKIREYNKRSGEWFFVVDKELENKYIKEIKEAKETKLKKNLKSSKYGVYGTISNDDDKFRIVIEAEKGKHINRGKDCKTYTLKDLITIYTKINFYPMYKKINEKESHVNKILRKYMSVSEINNLSAEQKQSLVSLTSVSAEDRCKDLQNEFNKLNILTRI